MSTKEFPEILRIIHKYLHCSLILTQVFVAFKKENEFLSIIAIDSYFSRSLFRPNYTYHLAKVCNSYSITYTNDLLESKDYRIFET
jgi:hypothetical protein